MTLRDRTGKFIELLGSGDNSSNYADKLSIRSRWKIPKRIARHFHRGFYVNVLSIRITNRLHSSLGKFPAADRGRMDCCVRVPGLMNSETEDREGEGEELDEYSLSSRADIMEARWARLTNWKR